MDGLQFITARECRLDMRIWPVQVSAAEAKWTAATEEAARQRETSIRNSIQAERAQATCKALQQDLAKAAEANKQLQSSVTVRWLS